MQKLYAWILLLAVLVIAGCPGGKDSKPAIAIDVPAAGVVAGEPLKWRTLAEFTEDAAKDHPRPGMVVGEFTKDHRDDILLIDWMGKTQLYQTSGKHEEVKSEIWPAIFTFTAWDYNRDGRCELVPGNYGLLWVPEAQGYVKVGSG